MKTYKMLINGTAVNDYIKGRISGMVCVLTGMPDKGYPWKVTANGAYLFMRFDATEEQCESVVNCIKKYYPNAFRGITVIE